MISSNGHFYAYILATNVKITGIFTKQVKKKKTGKWMLLIGKSAFKIH